MRARRTDANHRSVYEKAVRHMQWGFGMSESDARRAIGAILDAGLHVVTAADKAVLDAALDYHLLDTSVNEQRLRHYCRVAELTRREYLRDR